MNATGYPVHVDASLDTRLSRWLWLVKWVLAIPHFVVLAFLWAAFVVLSVVAFVAILATGRYPRAIFDFNVGVLRWTWRVAYYSHAVLGTDRYPPFTLGEVPDYPAHLTVEYPERLSRGLVLVKWWLLAIPHYIIVALLAGGAYWSWGLWDDGDARLRTGGGLIGLLVLVAGVVLLVSGRYPTQMFDILLGLNRWVLRVAGYAALMTDDYPPFRLDLGGRDPRSGAVTMTPASPPPPAAAPPPSSTPSSPAGSEAPTYGGPPTSETRQVPPPPHGAPAGGSSWGPGRVLAVVLASLLFLVGWGFLAAGGTVWLADQTLRDDDGFLMSPTEPVATETYAVVSDRVLIDSAGADAVIPEAVLGDVRIEVEAPEGREVFVGIAPAADVADYLAGVGHAELLGFESVDGVESGQYRVREGGAPQVPPAEHDGWAAAETGSDVVTLTWEPEDGDWTAVVMNADGSAEVSAEVAIGATAPLLGWLVTGLLVTGAVLLVVSMLIIAVAVRGGTRSR